VIKGDAGFFAVTKRIHNGLYGGPGDGGALGPEERRHYEAVQRENAEGLLDVLTSDAIVLLHDPQTAGMAPALRSAGRLVLWRCHVGLDEPNNWSERAWAFLRPYLADVDGYVFSRAAFAPPWGRPREDVCRPPVDRPVLGEERARVGPERPPRTRLRRTRGGCGRSTGRTVHSP
jgi:trehalose synthase